MLINDLIAMLMNMPTPLAIGWGAWFAVGLGLSIWSRREKSRLVMHGYDEPAPTPRPKSGPRPSARPPVQPAAVTVPQTAGNPFGDLEALFNDVQEGTHRTPGEAPAPAAAAAPALAPAVNEPLRNAPVLAAPQSLP